MTTSIHKNRINAGLILIACFLSATFILYLAGHSSLYAQDADIYIGNTASNHSNSRPAVYFSHEDHMDSYDCLDCHHDYKNGKNVLDEDDLEDGEDASCASCHTKDASIDLETGSSHVTHHLPGLSQPSFSYAVIFKNNSALL